MSQHVCLSKESKSSAEVWSWSQTQVGKLRQDLILITAKTQANRAGRDTKHMSLGPMKTAMVLQFLIPATTTSLLHSKYGNQMNFGIP